MNKVLRSKAIDGSLYRSLIKKYKTPLLLLDCEDIVKQYCLVKKHLPNVGLYYPVKAFSHPDVIQTLVELGSHFDVASNGEIDLIKPYQKGSDFYLHTNPIRKDSDIQYALENGCSQFVVDNLLEIKKFIPYKEKVRIYLRINFSSSSAIINLSEKFGCPINQVCDLINRSHDLGIKVIGLTFHVGSQCLTSDGYVAAINECIKIINRFPSSHLQVLNIGGGFPVSYHEDVPSIEDFCQPIREALKKVPDGISIVAEPGRCVVASCAKTICSVVGLTHKNGFNWYYIDDGIYGTFSGQFFDKVFYPIEIFSDNADLYDSVIAGPTCDGIDVIAKNVKLPLLDAGDLIVGHMMGAYSAVSATNFNSIPQTKVLNLTKMSLKRF